MNHSRFWHSKLFLFKFKSSFVSYILSVNGYTVYLNDIPRFSLGIVFLWFGIDKFIIHDFYLSWFSATERVRVILPIQDLSLSIYAIGVVELIFAVLLFTGIRIRWVSLAVIVFILVILLTAQYPSSFPQDIGLLGIASLLFLTNATWKKAQTEKFLNFLWVMRYPIAAVLLLWAVDQITNIDRHIGWIQLSSPISEVLSVVGIRSFLVSIFVVEIVLGVMLAIGKVRITKYSLVAVTVFLVFARIALDPPINNHQTVGLALATAWLAYIAFSKNRV